MLGDAGFRKLEFEDKQTEWNFIKLDKDVPLQEKH
jgi:hypothetical protein